MLPCTPGATIHHQSDSVTNGVTDSVTLRPTGYKPATVTVQALKGLKGRLGEMLAYLQAVLDGKIPVNHEIIADMQDMINLLPNLNVDSLASSLTGALPCPWLRLP